MSRGVKPSLERTLTFSLPETTNVLRVSACFFCPPQHVLHTSAYVSIRQHTSAYVSIRQHMSAYVSIRQHTSAYVSIRQHTSAYVSIRQHTSSPCPSTPCTTYTSQPLANIIYIIYNSHYIRDPIPTLYMCPQHVFYKKKHLWIGRKPSECVSFTGSPADRATSATLLRPWKPAPCMHVYPSLSPVFLIFFL